MSEITKPIALDESLHTTEPTPRNLADVLSDELQNLATAISGGSDKVPKTDIATVEPTNTASRAYSVGELVYVNGNLYKVITAITIGATFTVGTNIQSANVSGTVKDALDGLTSIKSTKTITDPTIGSITFTLFKNGIKGVLVQSSGVPSSAYTSTAIIPSAYLPQTNFFVVGSTWVNAKYRRFSLISDGRVQVGASDENGLAVTGFYM